jgi:SAM-dependent methyltransferase
MELLLSHLQFIQVMLRSLDGYRPNAEWLATLLPISPVVADFGCSVGHETLALALFLEPAEIVGIDVDPEAIRQAQDTARNLRDSIDAADRLLPYIRSSRGGSYRSIVEFVAFLKARPMPQFLTADVSKRTPLSRDHFDLAYCERVLYCLACAHDDPSPNAVSPALAEMFRVIKPGGLFVGIEPISCSPQSLATLDLGPTIESVGGTLVIDEATAPHLGNMRAYVARKWPSSVTGT